MAAEAALRDPNNIPSLIGAGDVGGQTKKIKVKESNGGMYIHIASIDGAISLGSPASDKVEDSAHASGDTGSFMLGVRNDSIANLTSTDGDYSPIAVDQQGRVLTRVTGFADLSSGTSLTTSSGLQVVGPAADGAAVAGSPVRVAGSDGTTTRSLLTDSSGRLILGAGTNGIGKLTANSGVTIGAVEIAAAQTLATVTTVSTLTNITNWGNIVDNAGFTDTTTRISMNGYIFDEVAGTALTENDGAAARIDSKRAQVFVMEDESTRGRRATVTTRKSMLIEGPTASGSSVAAAPVTIGGRGATANPTAVTDGQVVNAMLDKLGKQVVVGSLRDLKAPQTTTITSSTSETTIVTAVASTFLDLYGLIITNTSATAVNVAIKDATAGTTRMNIAVPAGETRGFMLPEGGAWNQASSNNNWTATCSASVASVIISAFAVKNI